MLIEIPLSIRDSPIPAVIDEFACAGLRRGKSADCFDFVPSDYALVYRILLSLPRGSWCEWGSGMGINTGIAAHLGFQAVGIEIDSRLATASRDLLAEFGLSATIRAGSYFDIVVNADFYFVYCWPGQMSYVEDHFLAQAPDAARLLICHGAEDIRCKAKRNALSQ